MLETTLTTTFVPGANLKGQVAGANWVFLLPNLNLERVVCLGAPSPTTLTTLSRLSREVVVACVNSRQMRQVSEMNQKSDLTNIRPVAINNNPVLSLPGHCADLVLVVGGYSTRRLTHDQAMLRELRRLLKPEGFIYFEFGGPVNQVLSSKVVTHLTREVGVSHLFWLTPMTGEMRTAVPLYDGKTIDYFLRHGIFSPAVKLRLFNRVEQLLNKRLLSGGFVRRYGTLVACRMNGDEAGCKSSQQGGDISPLEHPPQYLCSIAQAAGVNLEKYRWGLSARGEYSSRKVLFFLFDRTSGSPEYIVKMVRDAAFNARLENEYRALSLLYEWGIGHRETLPQAVFFGHHSNLAILGETMIDGVPFRQQTKATADCPYARAAINWLTDLGATTADSTAATPAQVAESLMKLFTQFTEIYQLTQDQHTFLNKQIATIGRSQDAFPLVFQHGDPGTWNVMLRPTGQPVFLDWEAAEPQGMPLWDLFYFMRSYGVWAARLSGTRDSLKGFSRQFLVDSALSRFLIEATDSYCQRSGLPHSLVEPLFFTCWMHRALKEATRLTPTKLEDGHYVNLLRLCIEQRNSAALRRLFL
jgi:hypothetical protein